MKASVLALLTAAALSFGATSVAFAQDATTSTPPTDEECLVEQGAGATPPGESLVSEEPSDDSESSSEPRAVDDKVPEGCPDLSTED